MAGISSQSLPVKLVNRYKYNGIELNNKEFGDNSGLEIYGAPLRSLDPQIGRWFQLDPQMGEYYAWTPYNSNLNNPIKYSDPNGDCPTCPPMWERFMAAFVASFISMQDRTAEYKGSFERLSTQTSGNLPEESGISGFSANMHQSLGTLNDVGNMADAVGGFYQLNYSVASLSGMDVIPDLVSLGGDVVGGDVKGAGLSLGGLLLPGISAAELKLGGKVAKEGGSIWTSTKRLSAAENAFTHFKKHGTEFPEFFNSKQYVEGTKSFLNNSPQGTLVKTRPNGDVLKYHPASNTFGVMDNKGVPRTMFRPIDGIEYWLKQ
jgi:RHS repeat-associated protein